jgi:glutamate-5-semialdehyde dehydrogenase
MLMDMGHKARSSAKILRRAEAAQRTAALLAMADAIRARAAPILQANAEDRQGAEALGLSRAMVDRLALSAERVEAMARGLEGVAAISDPIGEEDERWRRPNGLDIARVRTPIGVLAMIYEARPNVTADAAALSIRSGNAVILRCGKECLRSATAIHDALAEGLSRAGLPSACVQIVPCADREAVGVLLEGLGGTIDLLIPRGGKALVQRVAADARVPVLSHEEGLNHTYVHAKADPAKARAVVLNAKMRRVSVCGATETLLVDADAASLLAGIAADLRGAGCELRGDPRACALEPTMVAATEADWRTEYLEPILAVKIVDDLTAALEHIEAYGSGHTDAIITEDPRAAERFLAEVDSAIVLHNASTQFADGGEFGFGGEIGIATGRLHARGPVGAKQLTTYKYVVRGTGQTRP